MQTDTPSTPAGLAQHPNRLLTDVVAAQYIGVAVQTMRNWRWRGAGPKWIRIGERLIRYRQRDLDAFIGCDTNGDAA